MQENQVIELTREIPGSEGVTFDPEKVCLEGRYLDEISAYRAKKSWGQTLERCFMLDINHDFRLVTRPDYENGLFHLRCEFCTACARYAFWRLIHQQAPEAQYLIETAHIPQSESFSQVIATAADLAPSLGREPLAVQGNPESHVERRGPMRDIIDRLVKRLSRPKL